MTFRRYIDQSNGVEPRQTDLAEEWGVAIQRGLSDVTNLFSGSFDENSLNHRKMLHHELPPARQTPRAMLSPLQRPSHPHQMIRKNSGIPSNADACFLCSREASILDHVCPCCHTLVCGDCISRRLPFHDL